MLIVDGQIWWLIAIVCLMFVAAIIALFARNTTASEFAKPLILADEERQALDAMALETKKRVQLERKMQRKVERNNVNDEGRR